MIEPAFLASLRRRHRAEMVLVLIQLEHLGLIRRYSLGNGGGTWVWWVKRTEADAPRPEDEPSWLIRDHQQQHSRRIPISQRFEWADRHGIPRQTMRSFLMGNQRLLRGRWELKGTPMECDEL